MAQRIIIMVLGISYIFVKCGLELVQCFTLFVQLSAVN